MVMILITVAESYWEPDNRYHILEQMKTFSCPELVDRLCLNSSINTRQSLRKIFDFILYFAVTPPGKYPGAREFLPKK